jgi:anti-anti-sigma regulatory factor
VARSSMVDQLVLGDHVCWTFDDDDERLDTVARFVATGVARRHRVLYFTESLTPREVLAGLGDRDIDVDPLLSTGQLGVVPAAESYLAGGEFQADAMVSLVAQHVDQARRDGYTGLRLAGDMTWALRDGDDVAELSRYEAQLNHLLLDGGLLVLCLYDRRAFSRRQLDPLASAHPSTADLSGSAEWSPMLRIRRTPQRVHLVGEADISNRAAFAAVLARLSEGHPCSTGLDISELTFTDIGTANMLRRAMAECGASLQVVGGTPRMTRLLTLLGMSELSEKASSTSMDERGS